MIYAVNDAFESNWIFVYIPTWSKVEIREIKIWLKGDVSSADNFASVIDVNILTGFRYSWWHCDIFRKLSEIL